MSSRGQSHDQLLLSQLEKSTGEELKANLKTLTKKIKHSEAKRHSLLQKTDIVERIIGVIKARRGMDHIALQMFIDLGVDAVGAESLLEKGVRTSVICNLQYCNYLSHTVMPNQLIHRTKFIHCIRLTSWSYR